jgi:iron complex transport system substrate-binding protein
MQSRLFIQLLSILAQELFFVNYFDLPKRCLFMFKLRVRSFILLFILLLGLAACTPASGQPAAAKIDVKDGLQREVKLDGPAKRIVSLSPSNTEILFALGAGAQVVGRDEFSDYPAEAKPIPRIGGSNGKYNMEAIAALKPDLVLAAEFNTPDQVKALEQLNLTVYYLKNPLDLTGLYANLTIVGQLVGKENQADTLSQSLKKRVDAITGKLANVTARPKVYYELDGSDPSKPYTAGPGSFVDSLITLAGAQNVAASMKDAYAVISPEVLISQNPDIIILGDSSYGITTDSIGQRPGWDVIAAVKNKQIYPFDDNLVSRPGPRLVDGLEAFSKIIHPDLFK